MDLMGRACVLPVLVASGLAFAFCEPVEFVASAVDVVSGRGEPCCCGLDPEDRCRCRRRRGGRVAERALNRDGRRGRRSIWRRDRWLVAGEAPPLPRRPAWSRPNRGNPPTASTPISSTWLGRSRTRATMWSISSPPLRRGGISRAWPDGSGQRPRGGVVGRFVASDATDRPRGAAVAVGRGRWTELETIPGLVWAEPQAPVRLLNSSSVWRCQSGEPRWDPHLRSRPLRRGPGHRHHGHRTRCRRVSFR